MLKSFKVKFTNAPKEVGFWEKFFSCDKEASKACTHFVSAKWSLLEELGVRLEFFRKNLRSDESTPSANFLDEGDFVL